MAHRVGTGVEMRVYLYLPCRFLMWCEGRYGRSDVREIAVFSAWGMIPGWAVTLALYWGLQ